MRRFLTLLAMGAVAAGAGCSSSHEPAAAGELERFLRDGPTFVASTERRRQALEKSLVNPQNGYSRLRLDNYALEQGGWDALEVWNPPVRPMTTDDLGRFSEGPYAVTDGTFEPAFSEPVANGAEDWTHEAMVELGRRLFERFPAQLDPAMLAAVASPDAADEVGLWTDARERLGGLVRVRLPDGRESFSVTCATCHATPDASGELVYGRTNARFDRDRIGRMHTGAGQASAWGPGQIDVTADGIDNPTAITDLRAVRFQSHLHWAATLANSPEALSVRIETLLITSSGQAARPPREVAFALAYFLWSLGDDDSQAPSLVDEEERGRAIFDEQCSACHFADGATAGTASPALIGTDPAVVDSPMRTTGRWRIPSLWKVADRSQFLHDGSVDSLDELLDPARLERVPGHVFGTDLRASQRRELVTFLQTL